MSAAQFASSTPLPRLPLTPEVLLLVMHSLSSALTDPLSDRQQKRRTLTACTTVSKAFHLYAREVLYSFIELGSFRRSKKLIRALNLNYRLGYCVRVLVLPDYWPTRPSSSLKQRQKEAAAHMAAVAFILQRCPKIDILKMGTTKYGPLMTMSAPICSKSEGDIVRTQVSPFSNLQLLHLSHVPWWDFSIRQPLPQHIDFTRLEILSLRKFAFWRDDLTPMVWPPLPSLRALILEDCFLHGEELSSLLMSVKSTIQTIRLTRSIFSISILSDGLGVVADVLKELSILEHLGGEGVTESFDRFTALKVLWVEPASWGDAVYTRLPPNLETLCIRAMEETLANPTAWKILEDILAFLQSDIPSVLPRLNRVDIMAEASRFEPWADQLRGLCQRHGLTLKLDLCDTPPYFKPVRPSKWRQRLWHSLKSIGRMY